MRAGLRGRFGVVPGARDGLLLVSMLVAMRVFTIEAQAEVFTLSAGERRLSVTSHEIAGADPRPAVLVLSGTRGFAAKSYKRLATTLNSRGIDAFFVHFLSDQEIALIERAGSAASRKAFYARRWDEWTASVRAAIDTIEAKAPYRGRVGLIGVSLGASVATATALDNPHVAALVAVDGGPPEKILNRAKSIPPLLAVWGSADQVFSPAVGERLRDAAHALGGDAELEIYEREPHAFFLEFDNERAMSALTRVCDFFSARLKRPPRPERSLAHDSGRRYLV